MPFRYKTAKDYFKKIPDPDTEIPPLPETTCDFLKSIYYRLLIRDPNQ